MTANLKDKLRIGGSAFGPMVIEFFSPACPPLSRRLARISFSTDMEHSGAGFETMKTQFAGCRGIGVAPLVRVPSSEYHFVVRALSTWASMAS